MSLLSESTEQTLIRRFLPGVNGVVHVASVLTFSTSWKEVVEPSVNGALSLVRAAAKEPSVRRFALTSSSVSHGFPSTTQAQHWTADTWHDVVDEAKKEESPWATLRGIQGAR